MPNFELQYESVDIQALAAEYMASNGGEDRKMEDAGARIASGEYCRTDFLDICKWKSTRRIDLIEKNSDAEIELRLKQAISAEEVKAAVSSLTELAGVGVKMASAILTAIKPEQYTVLDFRALEALGVKDSELCLYIAYLEACRNMAKDYKVSMRDFDRANWRWSKKRSMAEAQRNRSAKAQI